MTKEEGKMKKRTYVYPPKIRAILAQVRREQRLRQKQRAMEAQVYGPTSTAPSKTPNKADLKLSGGVCH